MNPGGVCVYQIYLRSFFDANGDGVGDLAGITAKLDYIASLGVDYIWLNPFFPSPQNDNGYDVSDYCAVDPLFGTMADFETLTRNAAAKGIGVMLDMVFNHSSTEHPWFKAALAGDKKYRDFYYFLPAKEDGSPPTNWVSKFGGSAWEKDGAGGYYLHLFDKTQADLNWDNPAVREELAGILRFWIKKGVKGFRFDVFNLTDKGGAFLDDGAGDGRRFYTDGRQVLPRFAAMRNAIFDADGGGFLTVGEASSTTMEKCAAYSNPKTGALTMTFHFHHLKTDYPDGEKWRRGAVDFPLLKKILHEWQVFMGEHGGWDALFWNNHDQPRALTRFASAKSAFHYQSATMLAAVIHFMRGTPYIYMGEEIGMTNPGFQKITDYRDVETLRYHRILRENGMSEDEVMRIIQERSRDGSRTPMQWTADISGFSAAGKSWIQPAPNSAEINAQSEEANPRGVLAFYKRLIALRKELPVIQSGSYTPVLPEYAPVFAYRRDLAKTRLACVNNFFEEGVQISSSDFNRWLGKPIELLASNYDASPPSFEGGLFLRPYETAAFLF
ncbi:MAG: alpha,alpha-phosphotrehalase [Spirochaetaceae bacterium]|nr:alpha,alpha-phosphotrehalase [Spirochaetaceae bacterium]